MKLLFENFRKYITEKEEPFQTGVYQLFIPRACPGEKCDPQRLANAPAIANGPKTLNKPEGGLWTSTAYKNDSDVWTSEWNDWLKYNMKHWMNPKGILLKVNTANVYHIDTDEDVKALAQEFPRNGGKEIRGGGWGLGGAGPAIDFEAALKKYDGIHLGNYKGDPPVSRFGWDNMWDVESTVWRSDAFGSIVTKEALVDVEHTVDVHGDEHPPWEDEWLDDK